MMKKVILLQQQNFHKKDVESKNIKPLSKGKQIRRTIESAQIAAIDEALKKFDKEIQKKEI